MFSINTFEDRLQQHLKETFNVKTTIERNIINDKKRGEKSRIIIKITGQMKDIESALDDLMNLFSSLRTRKFDDKTGKKIFSKKEKNSSFFLFKMVIGQKLKKQHK